MDSCGMQHAGIVSWPLLLHRSCMAHGCSHASKIDRTEAGHCLPAAGVMLRVLAKVMCGWVFLPSLVNVLRQL